MKTKLIACALVALAGISSSVRAGSTALPVSPIDDQPDAGFGLVVSARSADGGFASWSAPSGWSPDGNPIDLRDSRGSLLGSFNLGNEQFRSGGGPHVSTNLSTQAGPSGTLFTITFIVPLDEPVSGLCGHFFGDATVTDTNQNGATMTGQHAGSKAVSAFINGDFDVDATVVQSALDPIIAEPSASAKQSFDFDCIELPEVSSLGIQWKYLLTAGDTLSGSATFELGKCCAVPLPTGAAMGLVGLGFVVARRRRA